jgi:hypothetical protein
VFENTHAEPAPHDPPVENGVMPLQVVCVQRKGKGDHRHVTTVGVRTSEVVIRFSVKTVRKVLKRRTAEFYCVGPDGETVPVRRFRCACGAKTIRTDDGDILDGFLSALPTCLQPGSPKATGLTGPQPST